MVDEADDVAVSLGVYRVCVTVRIIQVQDVLFWPLRAGLALCLSCPGLRQAMYRFSGGNVTYCSEPGGGGGVRWGGMVSLALAIDMGASLGSHTVPSWTVMSSPA